MHVRQTVDVRMKRTFSSKIEDPFVTISLMVPMPRALIVEPLMPVTVLSTIGYSFIESEQSGEIWVVQALSSRKGEVSKERVVHQKEVGGGAAVTAARSNSSILLLLSHQSTEVWSDS